MSKVITLSFCHLQVTEREREYGGGAHRHKDMRRSSLKSIYKAQVSPLLNPSGPSHPAIIPIFPYLCSQNDPISNLRICLPASLPAFLVIHLWRINYCVPNSEYILQLSDEVKKNKQPPPKDRNKEKWDLQIITCGENTEHLHVVFESN